MGRQEQSSPMLPLPATVLLDLDPAAYSYFVFHDLGAVVFAFCVLAAGSTVRRQLCVCC